MHIMKNKLSEGADAQGDVCAASFFIPQNGKDECK